MGETVVTHDVLRQGELDLVDRVDLLRLDACRKLEKSRKAEMGQFLNPAPVARLMASMLACQDPEVYLLDPGAGVGSLFAASVAELCRRPNPPTHIHVTAYEIDEGLAAYIPRALQFCREKCEHIGINFTSEVHETDFIERTVTILNPTLFSNHAPPQFNCVIINPPYRKIHTQSEYRKLMRSIGIETSNLYTAFLAASVRLLDAGGEMVAITPRSFCNGPYFKSFRKFFLSTMALRRLHVFESRQRTFREDNVLQENVIFHAVKGAGVAEDVLITSSVGPDEGTTATRRVEYSQIVRPDDPQYFIRIVPDDSGQEIAERMATFKCSLDSLGLSVSTGRVVDFRARQFLRAQPGAGTAPLVYPTHFKNGYVQWPKTQTKKPNALMQTQETRELLVPNDNYVLTRRFSTKEEKKRIVAAVHDAARVPGKEVAFENHLNYFHRDGRGLDFTLAKGLAAFLNSTLVDAYFRQFNGHTQVNATDLRSMRYPTLTQLEAIGSRITAEFPEQEDLDKLIQEELLSH